MKPLDRLASLKTKLGIVIVVAIGVTCVTIVVGNRLGVQTRWTALAAVVLSLGAVQIVARGMTRPLREMADAAEAMARGEHGRRVRVTTRDEVGRLARAFNAMSAELEATDRMRRDLVANVSHDLRTPLAALQAALENLVDGVQEPDPETLRAMHAQVQRLSRLVAQLLDLSQFESEGVTLALDRVDARELLDGVRAEAQLDTPEGVRIDVDVVPPGLALRCDRERTHQLVANLIENALRHSPVPGTVMLRAATASDGHVSLEVLDDGPGIPPELRAQVFERFTRGDVARAGEGSGLGLAICRWIADLHGGSIRAEGRQPRGCRIVVELESAT